MSAFRQFILDWILSMINGFDETVANSVDVLTEDIFTGGMFTMAQSISNVIKPIALTIIAICFVIEFIKVTAKMDMLKFEYVLRVFFNLVFAKVAIDMSFRLLTAIYATGAEWIQGAGTTGSDLGSSVGAALTTIITGMSWYEALGLVCTMGISFLVIWLSGLVIIVMAYARSFELLIYIAVAPLPCAFAPLEHSRITRKFFLSFAGVVLQGLFIILSIKLYQAICVSAIIPAVQSSTELGDISFNMLLGAIVLVMAVVKSGSFAKSILDGI